MPKSDDRNQLDATRCKNDIFSTTEPLLHSFIINHCCSTLCPCFRQKPRTVTLFHHIVFQTISTSSNKTPHTCYSGNEHNSAGHYRQGGNPVLHVTYMCRRTLLVLWHKKQAHPSELSPGDRNARLWGDTTLDARAWRGSNYPRAHKPTVLRAKIDKHNCFYAQRTAVVKIHCRASRENPGLSRAMDSEVEMLNSSRSRALPKVKSSQSSERRRQFEYGLKTKSANSSSNVLQ